MGERVVRSNSRRQRSVTRDEEARTPAQQAEIMAGPEPCAAKSHRAVRARRGTKDTASPIQRFHRPPYYIPPCIAASDAPMH